MRGCLRLVAGLALLSSCVVATEPRFPSDARPIAPPAQFAVWWGVTEACSGLRGDFQMVRWYVVPDQELIVGGVRYDGYTWTDGSPRIVVAQGMLDGAGELIRHEMLHALLQHGGHPRQYFTERCGDIVSCVSSCAQETGGYPPPSEGDSVVEPGELEIRASIMPAPVSRSADSGWVAVVVEARNPMSRPVRVHLTNGFVKSGFAGIQFWFEASGGFWSGATAPGDTIVAFGAGQTRRVVFDTKSFSPGIVDVSPGTKLLTGGFSGAEGAPVTFEVVP